MMSEEQEAIAREVKRRFESAAYFEDLIKVLNDEFLKYDICIPLDGYRGDSFYVITNTNKVGETKHRFELIGNAFAFALWEYRQAVELRVANIVSGSFAKTICTVAK